MQRTRLRRACTQTADTQPRLSARSQSSSFSTIVSAQLGQSCLLVCLCRMSVCIRISVSNALCAAHGRVYAHCAGISRRTRTLMEELLDVLTARQVGGRLAALVFALLRPGAEQGLHHVGVVAPKGSE